MKPTGVGIIGLGMAANKHALASFAMVRYMI